MIGGRTLRSSSNLESNPIVHGLHPSTNHSAAATSFLSAALLPHRTSSPYDRKHVDLHFLLHANQSLFAGRTQDGASSNRHGFPRKSHVFDDVIRPPHHVHSLTTVGVVTGVIVFLTIGATAALALFCCRRSFRLGAKDDDDEPADDIDDCQMDEIDVIFDDDDVIPLFLSRDSNHGTRTRLELRHMAEPEGTPDGGVERGQGLKSSAGHRHRASSHPHGTTTRNHTYRSSGGLEVMTPDPMHDSYENYCSDLEIVTRRTSALTSDKPEANGIDWRASSEGTGYPALANGCRDGYRRVETEEEREEEDEEEDEEEVGAMETSLEDNNSLEAEFESAEND